MKHLLVIAFLIFGGVVAWRIGETLSSDAISMGLGIFFGMVAGIPAALMVMAAARRGQYVESDRYGERRAPHPYGAPAQPPVIVLSAPGLLPQGQHAPNGAQTMMELPQWSMARQERQFRVVGDRDEMVDEW